MMENSTAHQPAALPEGHKTAKRSVIVSATDTSNPGGAAGARGAPDHSGTAELQQRRYSSGDR
jgi:hypothetical protein